MKVKSLFVPFIVSASASAGPSTTSFGKIIKNVNIPACRNCIHFKPYDGDFTSPYSRCEKIGKKNIVTNVITYKFADECREDESKCGYLGKYFEEEPNIRFKTMKYFVVSKLKYSIVIIPFMFLALELRAGYLLDK